MLVLGTKYNLSRYEWTVQMGERPQQPKCVCIQPGRFRHAHNWRKVFTEAASAGQQLLSGACFGHETEDRLRRSPQVSALALEASTANMDFHVSQWTSIAPFSVHCRAFSSEWEADPWLKDSLAKSSRRGSQQHFHHIFAQLHRAEEERCRQFRRVHVRPTTVPLAPPTDAARKGLR